MYSAAATEEDTDNKVPKSEDKISSDFLSTLSNEQQNRLEYLMQQTEIYSNLNKSSKNDEASVKKNMVKKTKSK